MRFQQFCHSKSEQFCLFLLSTQPRCGQLSKSATNAKEEIRLPTNREFRFFLEIEFSSMTFRRCRHPHWSGRKRISQSGFRQFLILNGEKKDYEQHSTIAVIKIEKNVFDCSLL